MAEQKNEPKNQHIIPKCYLKQFVDPGIPSNFGPCVWIFDRASKIGKSQNIRSVLTGTDLYTFEGDYTIEKTLAQIENDYAVVFDTKISKHLPLSPEEHLTFCAFVAAMLQRTLKQKENIENFIDQIVDHAKQMEIAHGAPHKTSLKWEEHKKDAHKMTVMGLIPEVAKILYRMNVAFLCSPSTRVSYITSDAPAYLFNSQLQFQRLYSPGLKQKHVEVHMPLSPRISVCFSWVNNLRGYLMATEDMVHNGNRMVFGHAHTHFIANSKKVKRRWFRRMPLDPVFLLSFLRSRFSRVAAKYRRRKYYVRTR